MENYLRYVTFTQGEASTTHREVFSSGNQTVIRQTPTRKPKKHDLPTRISARPVFCVGRIREQTHQPDTAFRKEFSTTSDFPSFGTIYGVRDGCCRCRGRYSPGARTPSWRNGRGEGEGSGGASREIGEPQIMPVKCRVDDGDIG